jgi:hypothetical protein
MDDGDRNRTSESTWIRCVDIPTSVHHNHGEAVSTPTPPPGRDVHRRWRLAPVTTPPQPSRGVPSSGALELGVLVQDLFVYYTLSNI